jgi:KUP system potassium uptake protein
MASSTEAVSTPAIADHPVRAALLLGALGVVFGDIGTSPIYAFRESLKAAGGPSETAVFGVLSLVFWAIVLVVALKYVVFVMRADNGGEGGTMALLSLALPVAGPLRTGLLIVGLAGASLFFGDAMITPAISVLSAVEGLSIASPMVTPYVVPIATRPRQRRCWFPVWPCYGGLVRDVGHRGAYPERHYCWCIIRHICMSGFGTEIREF